MAPTRKDPAESGPLRFYYRDWRPTLYGRFWTRIWAWATSLGLLPDIVVTLLVKERKSGRLIGHVLVPVVHEGRRYLVSMLGGGSNWVLDQRATGGAAFLKRGRTESVMLVEIPPERRAPILSVVPNCHERPSAPARRRRRVLARVRRDRRRLPGVSDRFA